MMPEAALSLASMISGEMSLHVINNTKPTSHHFPVVKGVELASLHPDWDMQRCLHDDQAPRSFPRFPGQAVQRKH